MGFWNKVGSCNDIGDITSILFRCTNNYGHKRGEEPIKLSSNWYVWNINDNDFTTVDRLEGINKNSFIGLVFHPPDIIELLKGNKHLINYPKYE